MGRNRNRECSRHISRNHRMSRHQELFNEYGVTVTDVALTTNDGTTSLVNLIGATSRLGDEIRDYESRSWQAGQISGNWGFGACACFLMWSFWTSGLKDPRGLLLIVKWGVAVGFWICGIAWLLSKLGSGTRLERGFLYADLQLSFPDGPKTFRVIGPLIPNEPALGKGWSKSVHEEREVAKEAFRRSMDALVHTLSTIAKGDGAPRATAASPREEIVNCPNCGLRNRIRETHSMATYRCGSCQTELSNLFGSTPPSKPDPG